MPETYRLSNAHRPSLPPGSYEIKISWNLEVDGKKLEEANDSARFKVASERFWLDPAEIESVYPPEGTTGDYSNDLAHIAFCRDTLPWERSAKAGSDAPWLGLLLLNEEETAQCPLTTMTLQGYKDRLAAYSPPIAVHLEPGEEKESAQVIELPQTVPDGVLPQLRELSLLAHARVTENAAVIVNTVGVIASKRLPSSGRNVAHLVALENRFTGDEFPLPVSGGRCLLISLKSWSFTSQPAAANAQSTQSPFERLKPSWLQLSSTRTSYEKAGFVPLPHRFRSGESTASWYAGPLSCGVPIFSPQDAAKLVKLPAECADDLLWYDESLGMLNVTYAAAWELGRLLAIQNRTMFSLLHKWRRQQIHCHQAMTAGAHDAACCHIPQIQCACAEPAPQAAPELKEWISGLRKLQGIPYRYLLPDERLLPSDSIRFLAIDQNYISALLDGVFSSVRAPSRCPDECRKGELELLGGGPPEVTGFLLRSKTVAALPRLEVTANVANASKNPYHSARLSPSILLYLFEGRVSKVTLRQKPDTIHLTIKRLANFTWSNQEKRALALYGTSSAEFAKGLLDYPEELVVSVGW
ncbi:MAG TPA: hypothetical protein VHU83_04080 [Bryobacteraceae bacterium]|jgi:hypothetical protein|nr:hypothetical protein [Bryobacteraceae bacterium]